MKKKEKTKTKCNQCKYFVRVSGCDGKCLIARRWTWDGMASCERFRDKRKKALRLT